eukprot:CAMPEP_0204335484 /NCGR_PEP_ID=MMETSP0469-20131031/18813_1 /ASSEMBLY_ACC=CAM_ASM_000384 /TAXON_ID=2969 /ORGANISM="Oxyrrhis marina" /LENGTH=33 /DNA_ID= /DNA_START= /DNA_END= /DNA_ORIENTATION=
MTLTSSKLDSPLNTDPSHECGVRRNDNGSSLKS